MDGAALCSKRYPENFKRLRYSYELFSLFSAAWNLFLKFIKIFRKYLVYHLHHYGI